MKTVIKGRVYDTEKARSIACWTAGYAGGHPCWQEETLYQTRSGLYFFHGVGGPESRYGTWEKGLPPTSGERIVPLQQATAHLWLESRQGGRVDYDAAAIRRLRGEPDPEVADEVLMVKVPAPMKDLIRAEAARRQVSLTTVVMEAIAAYLA